MPLPCPGPQPISLANIQSEFGGSNPIGLGEYYRNGAYVGSNNTNVPTSGPIKLSNFFCAVNEIVRYITATSTNVNASSYFTAGEWSSSAPKRLVINSGVTVGADSFYYFNRYYSNTLAVHFYSANPTVEFLNQNGYGLENANYFAAYRFQAYQTTALYRAYYAPNGAHILTTNQTEYSNIINGGWTGEGIVGYVYTTSVPNSIPIYRSRRPNNVNYLFSTSSTEGTNAGYVNEGIAFYAPNPSTSSPLLPGNYALNIPSGFGGTFRLDNYGSIQGAGGAANSGTGGNAIFAGAAISINNQGTIYSGGGGGGQGGTGGAGSYPTLGAYQYLGASGWNTFPGYGYDQYGYRCQQTCVVAFPGYANVYASLTAPNAYRNKYCCVGCCFGSCCDCCNSDEDQDAYASCCYGQPYITVYTSGGAGGNGGVGRGYNQSAAGGLGGAGGGTNAGNGGTGGTGGDWGTGGGNGFVGANGNAGGAPGLGSSGGPAYGGLAGFYIVNNANVTWIATGTRAGRVG